MPDSNTPVLGGIGQFLIDHGLGGSSDASAASSTPSIEWYQQMADGTHLVRQGLDATGKRLGAVTDEGLVAAKTAPTDKPVVRTTADGATWAFQFNPDGTVASSTRLAAPAEKPGQQSVDQYHDAETQYVQQKMAEAQAVAPYDQQKAAATVDNLQSQIAARTDLEPAQKQLILARITDLQNKQGLTAAKVGQTNSTTDKNNSTTAYNDAKTQAMLQGAFLKLQGEYAAIDASVGQPGGPATQADADAVKQRIFDEAAKEAATGMTAPQQATAAYQQGLLADAADKNALTQADSHATDAASIFNNSYSEMSKMAANMAPGNGAVAAKGFLAALALAPSFQSSMGGGLVALHPNAANMPVTPEQKQRIADLVQGGVPPGTAIEQVGRASGVYSDITPGVATLSGPQNTYDPGLGAGPVQPGWGAGNPDYQRQLAMGAGAGTGDNGSGGFLSNMAYSDPNQTTERAAGGL